MDLKDKVVLVTGGSRGIGRACCVALAAKGAKVAVNYCASPKAADEVVAEIASNGGEAISVGTDVSDITQVQAMVTTVTEKLGPVDILVNNAGVYLDDGKALKDMTLEQWNQTMAINLTSTFLCCQAVIPGMEETGEGKIIMIGSCAGIAGQWTCGYVASKAGQQGLMMALARELTATNIHVNMVAPGGAIDTDMHAGWLPGTKESFADKLTPSGRFPLESGIGKPEDIAHAVVFVAENDHVNGELLKVSGGTCICP